MKKPVWILLLLFATLAGAWLRFSHVNVMEYKEDEAYNFTQSQLPLSSLPLVGMPSGVFIKNPGLSVWIFAGLAHTFHLNTPLELAFGVQMVAWLGILSLLLFIYYLIPKSEQEPWLWAFMLAMVNPFAILYERKLWPEPFLPIFCVIFLAGFLQRKKPVGAFIWGITGPLLGQIHLSGFFLTGGFFIWNLIFDRKTPAWRCFVLGGALGALPMLPWLADLLAHPTQSGPVVSGVGEALQLKYWVFWLSDSIGVHLGNTLGIYRGDSAWEEISDFIRYPLWHEHPTYGVGLAHLTALGSGVWIYLQAIRAFFKGTLKQQIPSSFSQLILGSAFLGMGLLLTLTGVVIRRYYLVVSFPLEFLLIATLALHAPQIVSESLNSLRSSISLKSGRLALFILFSSTLALSAGFVHYVFINHGSIKGDYGAGYDSISQTGH